MNSKNSTVVPKFVEFNDNNLEHVSSGPDYGQPESSSNAWTELESKEYPDFVKEIANKIFSNHPKFL